MRPVRFPTQMVVMPGTVLMSVVVPALMWMFMRVSMMVGVFVRTTFASVIMFVGMRMRVPCVTGQMHVKLRPRNRSPLLPRNVQVIFVQSQLLQLTLEFPSIHAEVQHRGNKHVATDAAEDVEVKSFHKHKGPSTKHQRSSKSQAPNIPDRILREPIFIWSLVLFPPPPAH